MMYTTYLFPTQNMLFHYDRVTTSMDTHAMILFNTTYRNSAWSKSNHATNIRIKFIVGHKEGVKFGDLMWSQ